MVAGTCPSHSLSISGESPHLTCSTTVSEVSEFFKANHTDQSFDWVITNPPFQLGEKFIRRSMAIARCGVAILTRTVFIESVGRYERFFKANPPSRFAPFTERVPMVKGRVIRRPPQRPDTLGSFGRRINSAAATYMDTGLQEDT